ncbi:MAG: SUMF1/EgtB/PvdO family nonheme iron enzyme [Lentisphaerales bacterium]|nr:SUMF1/EgtB/PvdO family nonheme iron enzyme [Lentisphaerales bacterium]
MSFLKKVDVSPLPLKVSTTGLAAGSEQAFESQSKYSKHFPLEINLKKTLMVFRMIPPGTFYRGSLKTEKGRRPDEALRKSVMSKSFYMGAFEVTQEQWQAVMGKNPSKFKGEGSLPVENVTWEESIAFCRKLEQLEGLERGTISLPTENQWEYACKAGSRTAFYTGNDSLDKAGWFYKNSGNKMLNEFTKEGLASNNCRTKLVGQKQPNAFGLYDMHGNVWEWCLDLYSPKKSYRNVRGGGWNVKSEYCRSALRRYNLPKKGHSSIGLRLVFYHNQKAARAAVQPSTQGNNTFTGIFQNRSVLGKAKAISKYRASQQGQQSLLKSLRWLKSVQNPDGSWGVTKKAAYTGFASLAFMAYGENGNSEEFGLTLKKAIDWMKNSKLDTITSMGYTHAIKSIAIAEAYMLTKDQDLFESLKENIEVIIEGQQTNGSYDYRYRAESTRQDLSFAAWNYQALRVAYYAAENHLEVQKSISKAIKWLKMATKKLDGFPYSIKGNSSFTASKHTMRAAGTYSLQIFGEGSASEIKNDIKVISVEDSKQLNFENCPNECLYGWYYATQAMFNAGGRSWESWNKKIQKVLIENQSNEGYWEYPGKYHGDAKDDVTNRVYATSLSALMLTTPYRYTIPEKLNLR